MLDRQLREEIASVNRDFLTFSGLIGGVQLNPDELLQTRGGGLGLKLYDNLELDPHLYAVMQKRKMAVVRLPWEVLPASDSTPDRRAAEFVTEQIQNLGMPMTDVSELGLKGFDGISWCLLDAILKGYAISEVMWHEKGVIGIDRMMPRDQRRFNFAITDRGWELRLLTRENTYQGIAVPSKKFVVHTFGDKDGNPYGSGLGSRLFWNVFFKRQTIQFWLIFADKFGSPTPIGKYPIGASDTEKSTLSQALRAITQGTSVTIPEGMAIELLEAVRSGTVNTYETLCRYQDEQISECVLGETGSTNQSGGGGSRARDEVGNETRLEQVQADADLLNETLNRTIVTWLTKLNFPEATPPTLIRKTPDESLDTRANRDRILFEMGYRLRPEKVIEIYGDGYELITTQAQPAPFTTAEFAEIKKGVLYDALKFAELPRDTVDQFAEQLRAKATPIVTNWLKEIQKLLDETGDLGEFQAKLTELYPDLPSEDLRELMAEAFSASSLAGFYEAEETDPIDFYDPNQPRDAKGRFGRKSGLGQQQQNNQPGIGDTGKVAPSNIKFENKKLTPAQRKKIIGYDNLTDRDKEDLLKSINPKYHKILVKSKNYENLSYKDQLQLVDDLSELFATRNSIGEAGAEIITKGISATGADFFFASMKETKSAAIDSIAAKTLSGKADQREKLLRLKSPKYDDPKLTQAIAESVPHLIDAATVANGKGTSKLKKLVRENSRGWSSPNGELNVGTATRQTMFHEFGHFIEFENNDARIAADAYLYSRRTGKEPKKLKELTGEPYGDDELAYEGDYFEPYIAKSPYRIGGPTEVISVGFEHFRSPQKLKELYDKDAMLFALTKGVIDG